MAKQYGITWWGKQWLNSLSNIDNSNRLPRGRSYANTGKVLSSVVNANRISAKVQGSFPKPYNIDITVPLFSEPDKKRLVDEVVRNPALVAQLLNRELPADLLQFAENQGIRVFPRTWKDFEMRCSCPDYAVPCKHLAAVIYTVAEEIDRNPFLVFEVHGLDLVKALEDRNIRIADKQTERIPSVESLLVSQQSAVGSQQSAVGGGQSAVSGGQSAVGSQQSAVGSEKKTGGVKRKAKATTNAESDLSASPEALSPITNHQSPVTYDFTTLPDIGAQILNLFKPHPLFYEKDFKGIIEKLYAGASKAARKLLRGDALPENRGFELAPEDSLHLVFDENLLLKTLEIHDKKQQLKPVIKAGLRDLVSVLLAWDLTHLHRTHPTTAALLDVFNFSLALAKNGAIMPQLLECEAEAFRIRWLPAVIVEEAGVLFEKIAAGLPPDLLSVETKKGRRNQSPKEMLHSLCALFIGHCVAEAAWDEPHPLPKMFFFTTDGKPLRFDKPQQEVEIIMPTSRGRKPSGFGKKRSSYGWYDDKPKVKTRITGPKLHPDTPQLLQLWLNNFYLTHKDFVPLVKVEDLDGKFGIELFIEYRPEPLRPPAPLKDVFKQKKYEAVKYDVLKDVLLLAEFFPKLNQIVESQGERRLVFDEREFVEVLLKMLPALGLFGINILLPKGLKHLVRPKATLLARKSPGKNEGSFLRFEDLMQFDWQVALGEQLVSEQEFMRLVRNLNGIVKIHDQYVLVDEDDLVKLFQKLEEPPKLKGFDALQVLLAEEWQGAKIGLTDEAAALIRQFVQPKEVPLPAGLNATLRPYQRAGYEWMMKNTRLGFGSLLADDMGLGKTVQVIAALLRFKEEGFLKKNKALVIVPTSLLTNWRKEIEKFAPSLRALVYHGQNRSFDVADTDVVITTYGIVRSEQAVLKKAAWYCTVTDEAQNIKNAGTEQTKSVKAIAAPVRIAMSGTPVENRLSEFWSIMDFTNKGYLGSPKQFTEVFAKPIQREGDQKQADLFRKITAPFLLRRLKSDKSIIADLPDKIENNQFATLTKEQAAVYQTVVQMNMKGIFDEGDDIRRQGLVLKMITALKQICNHPYQFLKKGDKSPDLSGKAMLLLSLLDNIYENGEKTLIFTQYHEMGELLSQFITETFGKEPLFLHGGTSRPQRDAMVEKFQAPGGFGSDNDTFILSLKAGGTGLNLTAASNVIHYDLWWNPAVEAQATDRAYRIGQQKNVMVWRLITQSTFEEKIDEMIRRKKDLANLTVATGENWIGNMTNEDLKALVGLG